MALDPRSMERLEALGRTLPKKLPLPEPSTGKVGASRDQAGVEPPKASRPRGRHPVEEAREPEDLFRALIQASADGNVPPHRLDQLRELEASRRPSAQVPPGPVQAMGSTAGMAPGPKSRSLPSGGAMKTERKAGATPTAPRRGSRNAGQARGQANDDQALYTAFAQLLLEDDSDD